MEGQEKRTSPPPVPPPAVATSELSGGKIEVDLSRARHHHNPNQRPPPPAYGYPHHQQPPPPYGGYRQQQPPPAFGHPQYHQQHQQPYGGGRPGPTGGYGHNPQPQGKPGGGWDPRTYYENAPTGGDAQGAGGFNWRGNNRLRLERDEAQKSLRDLQRNIQDVERRASRRVEGARAEARRKVAELESQLSATVQSKSAEIAAAVQTKEIENASLKEEVAALQARLDASAKPKAAENATTGESNANAAPASPAPSAPSDASSFAVEEGEGGNLPELGCAAAPAASTVDSLALKGGARNDHECVRDVLERHPLLLGRSEANGEKALLQIVSAFREIDFDRPLMFSHLKKDLKKMGAQPEFHTLCSDEGRAVVELRVEPASVSELSRDRFSSQNAPEILVSALCSPNQYISDSGRIRFQRVSVAKVVVGYSLLWQLLVSRN